MNINSLLISSRFTRHAPRSHAPALCTLLLALLAVGPGLAFAQSGIPNIINYQGKLTDDLGNPVPAGPYEVTFKIWNDSQSVNPSDYIWGRTLPVHVVTNGLFNVLLTDGVAEGSPRTQSLLDAFDGEKRYLGLTIKKTPSGSVTSSEISPRQRLVSAPFAIHSYSAYTATWAAGATNAGLAGTASYANYATNSGSAGKLGSLTTNDFLLVNKTTQTLNGSLTVNNGSLTLNSNLIAKGNVGIGTTSPNYRLSFASELGDKISLWGTSGWHYGLGIQSRALQIHTDSSSSDIIFGYGESTNVIETFRMKGAGALEVARTNPIVIKQFSVPDIPVNAVTNAVFDTHFAWYEWSAVIAGFTFDGDIAENYIKSPFLRVRMVRYGTSPNWNWGIDYFLPPEHAITAIKIDVMFIRRELTAELR